MKLTTLICCGILILYGIFATVYAIFGFDLLFALCMGNTVLYRAFLSLAGVGALWLLFWLIAFRPTSSLS